MDFEMSGGHNFIMDTCKVSSCGPVAKEGVRTPGLKKKKKNPLPLYIFT